MWTFQVFTQNDTCWLKAADAPGMEGVTFVVYDNESITVDPANDDVYPVNASIRMFL